MKRENPKNQPFILEFKYLDDHDPDGAPKRVKYLIPLLNDFTLCMKCDTKPFNNEARMWQDKNTAWKATAGVVSMYCAPELTMIFKDELPAPPCTPDTDAPLNPVT